MAFLVYNDGIGTIIRMATVYGTEIGIGQEALIGAVRPLRMVMNALRFDTSQR